MWKLPLVGPAQPVGLAAACRRSPGSLGFPRVTLCLLEARKSRRRRRSPSGGVRLRA